MSIRGYFSRYLIDTLWKSAVDDVKTVGTTEAVKLTSTLSQRGGIKIYNTDDTNFIRVAFSGDNVDNGIKIAAGESIELPIGEDLDIYAIADTADVDVYVLEYTVTIGNYPLKVWNAVNEAVISDVADSATKITTTSLSYREKVLVANIGSNPVLIGVSTDNVANSAISIAADEYVIFPAMVGLDLYAYSSAGTSLYVVEIE